MDSPSHNIHDETVLQLFYFLEFLISVNSIYSSEWELSVFFALFSLFKLMPINAIPAAFEVLNNFNQKLCVGVWNTLIMTIEICPIHN